MRVSGYLYILEQFIGGASLLLAASRAVRLPRTPPFRLLLTALLGATAALFSALRPCWYYQLGGLALTLLSPFALWGRLPRQLRRQLPGTLLTLSLLLTGALRFLRFLPLPPLITFLSLCVLLPRMARLPCADVPACAALEIRCGASRMTLTALIDTGNLLRDPLSGLPVVVISHRAAQKLIAPPAPGRLNPGLRQIAIRTVAGTSVMTVFRPSSLRVLHCGAWQEAQAIIGIAPDSYDGVQALAPARLMSALSLPSA